MKNDRTTGVLVVTGSAGVAADRAVCGDQKLGQGRPLENFRYHVTLPALDLPQLASATEDRASVAQRRGFAKKAKNLCSARFFSHPPKYVIYVNGPDSRWSFSP